MFLSWSKKPWQKIGSNNWMKLLIWRIFRKTNEQKNKSSSRTLVAELIFCYTLERAFLDSVGIVTTRLQDVKEKV